MAVPKIYTETPRLPKASTIRFSRIHPEPPPPPLPPRPLHYSPRRPPQIPTPLLPSASVSPPPTPSKKAPWIMVNEPPPDTSGITLHRTSWSMLVCGTITMLLCFLGIAQSGRRYYLDSSLLSGFTTLLVGLLGLRARNWTRLPNRNFVTGK
ncbi:hypothetical protein B566_EDAN012456 [Ephemera danica]|nr:hypothetical protein B566_EDAN012456 [Ephemera danica]